MVVVVVVVVMVEVVEVVEGRGSPNRRSLLMLCHLAPSQLLGDR